MKLSLLYDNVTERNVISPIKISTKTLKPNDFNRGRELIFAITFLPIRISLPNEFATREIIEKEPFNWGGEKKRKEKNDIRDSINIYSLIRS